MHHAFDDDADAFANEARIGAPQIERRCDADRLKPPRRQTWGLELLLQTARTQDNESRVGTFRNNGRWVHHCRRSQGPVKCANPVAHT
jgi:hypothetical protein